MADKLQLVVTTPESTVLNVPAERLRFPLFDGQIGVLPSRAPLVGRLGYGELAVTTAQGELSYYIDGGFVQVAGSVVSLLTQRAVPIDRLQVAEAKSLLEKAAMLPATTEEQYARKQREELRARRMLELAK